MGDGEAQSCVMPCGGLLSYLFPESGGILGIYSKVCPRKQGAAPSCSSPHELIRGPGLRVCDSVERKWQMYKCSGRRGLRSMTKMNSCLLACMLDAGGMGAGGVSGG